MSKRITLRQDVSSNRLATRVGEVVGTAAAECVAVCCCFPCGLVNFFLLAIYKVPTGLCRRMLRKRRHRKMIKEGLLKPTRRHCSCGCCEDVHGFRIYPMCANDAFDVKRLHSKEPDNDDDTRALEKEMWDQFYGTGFWRSSSNREPNNTTPEPAYVVIKGHHRIHGTLESVVQGAGASDLNIHQLGGPGVLNVHVFRQVE
ncbi:hypothetical protein CR513_08197, partial [Mucuna pruriens]